MNNIYLLIIRLALYIHALRTAHEEGLAVAEEPQSICKLLDIDLEKLSEEDKVNLIDEICDSLNVLNLMRVQDLAGEKREDKLEDAKHQVIRK